MFLLLEEFSPNHGLAINTTAVSYIEINQDATETKTEKVYLTIGLMSGEQPLMVAYPNFNAAVTAFKKLTAVLPVHQHR